jgi:hypothetical protein
LDVVRLVLACLAAAVAGCGGGDGQRLDTGNLPSASAALHLSSPAFTNGAVLAKRYTCDGAGDEPPVKVGGVPRNARELVVIVSDPDAPGGTFVHLTRYGEREGTNSAGKTGWTPPCPPSGTHRYIWTAYALREPTNLKPGASPAEVTAALRSGVLARGTMMARYGR